MRRVIERAASNLPAAAGDGVNHALTLLILTIGAGAFLPSITAVDFHRWSQRGGESVVSIEQIRALQIVTVAVEDDIDAISLKDRKDILADLDQLSLGV